MPKNSFPGFHLPAEELSAFSVVEDIFILSTKQNKLVTFYCKETVDFLQWLEVHHVRDVKQNDGAAVRKEVREVMSKTPLKQPKPLKRLNSQSVSFLPGEAKN